MVKSVDTLLLGSSARASRFESEWRHGILFSKRVFFREQYGLMRPGDPIGIGIQRKLGLKSDVLSLNFLYYPLKLKYLIFQIRFLSSRAQYLSEKWGNTPVVLAGDFNSTPQSGIYKFLSSSKLNIMLYDRKELSGQKRCRPAQVLGENKETVGPIVTLDGCACVDYTVENYCLISAITNLS
ncbi:carbon catabolite repressor protein 4 homolog 3-like [Cajanus cajan]|uniref:carbon catabolite repressor protein 4 homolog 3-like n=1 Tax=Cajanus cajan TaxID=3821 RepID=UPI00098D9A1C|nr:carbon catabolite repressor protein 4 homolog 3-like [Cajanus cajan]